jgi:hypothetical protein
MHTVKKLIKEENCTTEKSFVIYINISEQNSLGEHDEQK